MSHLFICRCHSKQKPGAHVPGHDALSEWFLAEEINRGIAESFWKSQHMTEHLGSTLNLRVACIRDYCRRNPCSKSVAVEVHCNSVTSHPRRSGFFCLAWYKSKEAIRLSRSIIRELRRARPFTKNKGVCKVSHDKRWWGTAMEHDGQPLAFLEKIPCPSVIIELGYLSNVVDANYLKSSRNRYEAGRAIGKGILNYLEER